MKRLFIICSACAFSIVTSFAGAGDLPTAPPNLKEAEAQGLKRVTADDLKPLLSGVVESEGVKGLHKLTYSPDGSVAREGEGFHSLKGKWRIDDKNNAYCVAFNFKKGYRENCFAVFRSPDGSRYLDYDIADGFYAKAWHQAE